jgi:hypothetical protein
MAAMAATAAPVAAVAERASSALSPLPRFLVLDIFSLLPVDARARAACVCRGWHATLLEPSLWTRLDVSPSSGVRVRVTVAVLRGAAAKARGRLVALDASGCDNVNFDALLAVVRAFAGALRELRLGMSHTLNAGDVDRLLEAAPQLAVCHAHALDLDVAAFTDARRMLRNEPPFQALRLRGLSVTFPADADEASVVALAADLAAHASLRCVQLRYAPLATPAALEAVVDAALTRQMVSVRFPCCRFATAAAAPALARLLGGGGALTELFISKNRLLLLDAPAAALLADALRANTTLTELSLFSVALWRDAHAAAALLAALTGHASLRSLSLMDRVDAAHEAAAGAALGALVTANAPALTHLSIPLSNLGDDALRPLLEALPANTHLRTLEIESNDMSDACARDVLLPAVRANTSLWRLGVCGIGDPEDNAFMREAKAIPRARRAAAAAAAAAVAAAAAAAAE